MADDLPAAHGSDSATRPERRRVAYVLSLKGGVPSFNYREIEAVFAEGFEVQLFPTKISPGLYDPKPEWRVHRPSMARAAGAALSWLLRRPRATVKVIGEALADRALPELGLALQYSREMARERIEHIHCHFADRKMFVAYFASALLGIPFTVTVHSHELVFYADRKVFRRAMASASRIVTICDYNREFLVREIGIPHEKVETIRLVVPVADLQEDRRLKVLTVAKFHDYKGYDVLVSAARLMADDPVVFWVVGDGPVDVRRMASELISSGKVRLLGSVSDEALKILYQACDVFCLPSKTAPSGQKEGLPVSIMEAMAFSKPVVSTLHAGIPELVDSILVREGDPEALADAIRTYLADPALRSRDGARNREKVVRMHGPENVKQLVGLFRGGRSG